MINCEVELILTSSKICVLADVTTRDAEGDKPAIVAPSGATSKITDTTLYVPVVTLSKENDTKSSETLKSGFKRNIKWNKYRSQMTIQPQNNNLNYLIDSTLIGYPMIQWSNVNRLFVLSFARNAEGDNKDYFSHIYYVFQCLNWWKTFFLTCQ